MKNIEISKPVCIVANGEFPSAINPLNILKESKTIIACDGAVDKLIKNKYRCDIIIGDLDSISNKVKNSNMNIIQIKDQSKNDLRKIIDLLCSLNINEFSIIGATGYREDHTIGNIFSILDYNNDIDVKIYSDYGVFSCIKDNLKVKSFKGQQISLFATDKKIKITSSNLKYNFNYNSLYSLYSGTLNESLGSYFNIQISHGSLLVFQTYQ